MSQMGVRRRDSRLLELATRLLTVKLRVQTAAGHGCRGPALTEHRPRAGAGFKMSGEPKVKGFAECRRVSSTTYAKKPKGSSSVWAARKYIGSSRLVVDVV
jgi:hypothetical protein